MPPLSQLDMRPYLKRTCREAFSAWQLLCIAVILWFIPQHLREAQLSNKMLLVAFAETLAEHSAEA